MAFRPLNSQNSQGQNYGQVNDMVRQLNKEQVTKVYKGENGEPAVIIGKIGDGEYGLAFSDGTTTFLRITKDGIFIYDGTNDRVLLGKDEGGF